MYNLIKTIDFSISKFVQNIKLYKSQDNEIEFIYDILIKFKNRFKDTFTIFKIKSVDYIINKHYENYLNLTNLFLLKYKKNQENIPKDFDTSLWDTLIESYNNNILKDKEGFQNILLTKCSFTNNIFKDFLNYENEINKWCDLNNIKYELIINFLNNYSSNLINNLSYKLSVDLNYSKYLSESTIIERILKSFIHAFPLNYALKLDKTKLNYVTFNNYKVINLNTHLNNEPILLYLKIDLFSNKYLLDRNKINSSDIYDIKITNKIDIKWLHSALPEYFNETNFKTIITKFDKNFNIKINSNTSFLWQYVSNKIINSS